MKDYGRQPTLLNVTYNKPRGIKDDDGEWAGRSQESFEVIYKDDAGMVQRYVEPATAEIYFTKPQYRDHTYNKPQERIEKLDKKRVPISRIRYEIAKEMGQAGTNLIQKCSNERDWRGLNRVYGFPYSYAADFQPVFYFMRDWYNRYELKNVKLTKAFIDIETDLVDFIPDLDKITGSAYSPVNVVTVFLEEIKECYTFILVPFEPSKISYSNSDEYKKRYELYVQQKEQHEKLVAKMDDFIKDLNSSFDKTYGKIKYNIRGYNEEIDLIADVFRLLNREKPNFCLAWNMRFDLQYLMERIKVLGYDPTSVMCHPDFEDPRCYFHVDRKWFQMEKQYDYFYCSSYTQFICQMRLYASIRKSQQQLKSVSLNAIGDIELKDRKVEYPDETNIMYFPYVDWVRFIKYNIKDVLIQVGIERITNDVMTYYMRSHANWTPYDKIFRETHLLRNVREKFFNEAGWVQGNNINIIDNDDEEDAKWSGEDEADTEDSTFKGAILADPEMNDNVGMYILGRRSKNIFSNIIDCDMTSFYPANKISSNMDSGTLIYKAELNNREFMSGECGNRSLNTTYQEKDKNGNLRNLDITGEVINTYVSGNILTFGYNYLNFPSIPELFKAVTKELKTG